MNEHTSISLLWLLLLTLVVAPLSGDLHAESFTYVTLTQQDELSIPEGKTALVVFVASSSSAMQMTYTRPGASEVTIALASSRLSLGGSSTGAAYGSPSDASPIPLVGPATLRILRPEHMIGLKIVDTQQPAPSAATPNGTPSTAVVIPEDATGPVQIVLESSTDLINWVTTNPGTYGSTATNRFFRVRAIQQTAE